MKKDSWVEGDGCAAVEEADVADREEFVVDEAEVTFSLCLLLISAAGEEAFVDCANDESGGEFGITLPFVERASELPLKDGTGNEASTVGESVMVLGCEEVEEAATGSSVFFSGRTAGLSS